MTLIQCMFENSAIVHYLLGAVHVYKLYILRPPSYLIPSASILPSFSLVPQLIPLFILPSSPTSLPLPSHLFSYTPPPPPPQLSPSS